MEAVPPGVLDMVFACNGEIPMEDEAMFQAFEAAALIFENKKAISKALHSKNEPPKNQPAKNEKAPEKPGKSRNRDRGNQDKPSKDRQQNQPAKNEKTD